MGAFSIVTCQGASPLHHIISSTDDQMVVSREVVAMDIALFQEGGEEPSAPHDYTEPKRFDWSNLRAMGVYRKSQ